MQFKRATGFVMLAFADLKKHRYQYHLLYPAAFDTKIVPTWTINLAISEEDITKIRAEMKKVEGPYIEEDSSKMTVFVDPGPLADGVLGWPARNLIIWKNAEGRSFALTVLGQKIKDSKALHISSPEFNPDTIQVTGWEKNEAGIVGSTTVDLAPMMDPKRLAKDAADLNLKLIKWRLLPDLDLDLFPATKALLFGAGTLGCNVTRMLLGWGVKNITLVDNGKVSFSNPPRQSLFKYEDCLAGGRPKAECAAQRAMEIDPNANVKGVDLSIPMPGHCIQDREMIIKTIERLRKLVVDHDLLFLLTDSRESRWLPTLLGTINNKPTITIALGFDSFVAMRHGTLANGLGCYFCSDAKAPGDTMSGRTLDQQCTVTRPGISYMAAAAGVELAASMLQHPQGIDAPATMAENPTSGMPKDASVLGVVPHQIRGFLSHFQNMLLVGEAYKHCTACSQGMAKEVERGGAECILRALDDPEWAAQISGALTLNKLLESVDLEPVLDTEDGDFCLL
jgi:ubiquitin-like modifier-activating enzyme ATG7